MQTSSLKLYPTVAASLGTLQDSTRENVLVAQSRHFAVQVRQYVATQVHRWMSREPGIVQPPDPYYPDRHHWPMRTWLREKKETVRHLREMAPAGSPGWPWPANFRSECLCLPVVTDPVVLQVDLEELRFSGGARDFTSVITNLQTMLHDAGYAFLNLVPTWGRTLSPELLAALDGQFMSDASFLTGRVERDRQGRHYSVRRDDAPFQTLDPEVTSSFQLEDDGDTLMLTPEEQELLGVAMVTLLRLAHVRPREWSDSNTSRPELKRRRGGTDAPLSVPSWPGSDEETRVWGGPIPEVVGTSSLASGDAPMLTPDENMSSAGGGSQGSPGLESSTAMIGGYMTTTDTSTGQPYTADNRPSTSRSPSTRQVKTQGLHPHALPRTAPPVRSDGLGGSEE
ncbi:hypothetical protein PHMEG_00023959 [Phytophthora megakarya]|uniref:Uncharacterized protein n=1 Tax=Phytophthora megakarya TaxID=4795 RepID=A0A225VGT0_9STRA|nr:hypothetical protein PHMEG_00023959 [Phytophthora megakarya]